MLTDPRKDHEILRGRVRRCAAVSGQNQQRTPALCGSHSSRSSANRFSA